MVDERIQRSPEQQARYLLAHLLDFYRREDKSVWWEFFRLADLPPEDYLDEPQALGDLSFVERLSMTKRGVPVDRYSFPPQECEIREAELYTAKDQKFGKVVRLDRDACIVDVKKPVARADDHPSRVFAHNRVESGVLADSLMRLGEWVAENGAGQPGSAAPRRPRPPAQRRSAPRPWRDHGKRTPARRSSAAPGDSFVLSIVGCFRYKARPGLERPTLGRG